MTHKKNNAANSQTVIDMSYMYDLILTIAPGHTVRGVLATDQTDLHFAVWVIYDFLHAFRPLKEHSKSGGGYANTYWERMKKENSPAFVELQAFLSEADILAPPGKKQRRHKYAVIATEGLLRLLAIVEERLPPEKKSNRNQAKTKPGNPSLWLPDSTLATTSSSTTGNTTGKRDMTDAEFQAMLADPVRRNEYYAPQDTSSLSEPVMTDTEFQAMLADPVRRNEYYAPKPTQKMNASHIATVKDTIERFIACDNSMLSVVDQNTRVEKNTTANVTSHDVFIRHSGCIIIGVQNPSMSEPWVSVYSFINAERHFNSEPLVTNYARRLWERVTKTRRDIVKRSTEENVLVSVGSKKTYQTPVMKVSDLDLLFEYMLEDAAKTSFWVTKKKDNHTRKERESFESTKGLRKQKNYAPMNKKAKHEYYTLLKRIEEKDTTLFETSL